MGKVRESTKKEGEKQIVANNVRRDTSGVGGGLGTKPKRKNEGPLGKLDE